MKTKLFYIFGVFALGLSLLFAATPAEAQVGKACPSGNTDCAAGTFCDPGTRKCISGSTCSTDAECGTGLTCTGGRCVAATSSTTCRSQSDCSSGQTCTGGKCVTAASSSTGTACRSQSDCSAGQTCTSGKCVTSSSSGTTTAKTCRSQSDCSAGQTCTNNQCVATSTTSTGGSTTITPFTNPIGVNSINDLLRNVINFVLGFVGVIAAAIIIYGGIIYMTSAGNDQRINQGKTILTYGIVGLIITLAAGIIVQLVISAVSGS